MKTQQNSFLSNSIITLTRQVIGIVIGLCILFIIANGLGPSGQGKYTLLTYLPLMLMTFLNLGFNSSTVFFVSQKKVSLNDSFSTNIIIGIGLALISILIGTAFIYILSETKFQNIDSGLLFISLLALPGMFLMIFLQTIIQGIQDFKAFNTALVVQQFSTLLFLILFLFVLDLHLLGAILSFIFGYGIAAIYMIYYLIKNCEVSFSFKFFSLSHLKEMFVYGMKAHVSNMMTFLNYRLDILLIGYFLTESAVGLYTLAVNLGERLSIFSQSFSQVLLPRIASSTNEEDRNKLTSMLSRLILVLVIMVSILIWLCSDLIFALFFPEYPESSLLLKLLLPGLTLLTVEKILSNDLAGRGKPELNMYVSFFNVIINVILNLILIPRFGVKGAAISSTITYVCSFIIKAFIFKAVTKMKIKDFLVITKTDLALILKIYRNFRHRTAVNK
ncbi:flippase [Bacillus sp. EB106-08-02-XG196]|jgi:O-antigen/teichoic acid export membrane protein|uniref:flippase n=1 Tax=Bacillus sp. EB106-08-02-XG196 TaxID=2737049 RepID=UPI0015C454CC|nr:flippase [Bacillus sp. EB106-08-02-XG196]NWQ39484.1 flippase [Bacillus sp. EB106-08-02-XG196]